MYRIKNLFFLFLFSISFQASAQSPAVQWTVSSQRINSNRYIITIKAALAKGWYVYAVTDTVNGLDGPHVHFDNENILISGRPADYPKTDILQDKIFSK